MPTIETRRIYIHLSTLYGTICSSLMARIMDKVLYKVLSCRARIVSSYAVKVAAAAGTLRMTIGQYSARSPSCILTF